MILYTASHWVSSCSRERYLCVFSGVFVAHRCVWTSCHTTSSCTQKAFPLNASAGVRAGGKSSRTLSHSQQCGKCAASSSLCWILCDKQVRNVRLLLSISSADEGSKGTTSTYSPSTRLFTVGAGTCHPSQPLALLTDLVIFLYQSAAKVRQIACVEGGIRTQLPVSRVWLFLYLNVWSNKHVVTGQSADTSLYVLEMNALVYPQGFLLLLHLGPLSWPLLSVGWGSVLPRCWLE